MIEVGRLTEKHGVEAKRRMMEEDGECPGKGHGVRALLVRGSFYQQSSLVANNYF